MNRTKYVIISDNKNNNHFEHYRQKRECSSKHFMYVIISNNEKSECKKKLNSVLIQTKNIIYVQKTN